MAIEGDTAARVTLGELASSFASVARQRAGVLVAAVVGLTAMYTAADVLVPVERQTGIQTGLAIGGMVIAYGLTVALLKATGAPSTLEAKPRIGAYLGMSIVTGLAVLLGLVVLILPGLFLAARWMLAPPVLLNEGEGVFAALGRSWRATAAAWPVLIVAQFIIGVPLLIGLGIGLAEIANLADGEQESLSTLIATNAGLSLWSVASVILAVAAYRTLIPASDTLADVFA